MSNLLPIQSDAERAARALSLRSKPAAGTTPWGIPSSTRTIAPGIVMYSTGSHGGVHLSEERLGQLPDALRAIMPFAGPGWYEEDSDVNLVIIAFPEYFNPYDVWGAYKGVLCTEAHGRAADFLRSADGAPVKAIADRFESEHAHLYTRASMGTSGNGWTVGFARISDGHHVTAKGLTSEEAFTSGPVDISIFGDRIVDPEKNSPSARVTPRG